MKYFRKSLSLILSTFFTFGIALAMDIPVVVNPANINTEVGETIGFDLKISPNSNDPVYTFGATIKFDPKSVQFLDSKFDRGWMPLSRSPYEYTDNEFGIVTRTAGFPEAVKSTTNFAHFTFKVIKAGDTKISIDKGMAFNANNKVYDIQTKSISISAKSSKNLANDKMEIDTKPQTITLDIEGNTESNANDDYVSVVKHSLLNNVQTEGKTTYSIVNQSGVEVFKDEKNFNLSSSGELVFTVPKGMLSEGDYTIFVNSNYNNQKESSVATKEINIHANKNSYNNSIYMYVLIAILFVVILLLSTRFRRQKR